MHPYRPFTRKATDLLSFALYALTVEISSRQARLLLDKRRISRWVNGTDSYGILKGAIVLWQVF